MVHRHFLVSNITLVLGLAATFVYRIFLRSQNLTSGWYDFAKVVLLTIKLNMYLGEIPPNEIKATGILLNDEGIQVVGRPFVIKERSLLRGASLILLALG